MNNITHIGLDVHRDSIAVGIANADERGFLVKISNTLKDLKRLVKRLEKKYVELHFVYEAGPCGYRVYRQLHELGHQCSVIAPSLIPKRAGDRVKTDKRDAEKLARLFRAGELTEIAVPTEKQEALRDLYRAREDAKIASKRAKQTLNGFLLRYGQRYTAGKKRWTQAHFRWLESIRFEERVLNTVLDDYVQAVLRSNERVEALEQELKLVFEDWEQRPICEALMALRGVDLLVGMGVLLEVGDLRRFEHPGQFMSYIGLVPSENSSGEGKKRGAITKTGNGNVRRLVMEGAWCCRLSPRRTRHWRLRAEKTSSTVQDLSFKAMKRLHQRFWQLHNRRVNSNKVIVAVARELCGFIWAVAQQAYLEQELSGKLAA